MKYSIKQMEKTTMTAGENEQKKSDRKGGGVCSILTKLEDDTAQHDICSLKGYDFKLKYARRL
jgi:hypothetical protein